jgi:hypothetical protein
MKIITVADRIQARAIRRCGELLKQVDAGQGSRTDILHDATDMKLTRTAAATQAGMSERQKVTALRVASIPQPEFEREVESDHHYRHRSKTCCTPFQQPKP